MEAPALPDRRPEAPPARPRASIVIVGWRSAPHLLECLHSLSVHAPVPSHEVLVFLNEPADGLTDRVRRRSEGAGAVVMSSSVNVGFGGAVNRAARRAEGEFVVLLNDDATVEPGWLEALVAAADDHPCAGAVGSKAITKEGTVDEEGAVLWSDGSITLVDAQHRPLPPPPPGLRTVDYCSAVSLLVRRSTWESVGGFDEGYFPAYCEDVDLCLKVQAHGEVVLYQPASVVRHHRGASTSPRFRLFLQDRNTERLRRRWPHALASRPPPAPHRPRALSRALLLAAGRPPAPGAGPRLADAPAPEDPDPLRYVAEQLAVTREYATVLEAELQATSWSRLLVGAKGALRRVPPAYRWAARLGGRWAGGRSAPS
jgi:GT2 family glycosyltransferase